MNLLWKINWCCAERIRPFTAKHFFSCVLDLVIRKKSYEIQLKSVKPTIVLWNVNLFSLQQSNEVNISMYYCWYDWRMDGFCVITFDCVFSTQISLFFLHCDSVFDIVVDTLETSVLFREVGRKLRTKTQLNWTRNKEKWVRIV